MTDYTELKKLAEAAIGNNFVAGKSLIGNISAQHEFNNAANPAKVLQMLSHISELERRVGELQVDAYRYRYLRQGRTPDADPFVCIYSGSFSRWTLESCDSVVDSAIAHQSNNRG